MSDITITPEVLEDAFALGEGVIARNPSGRRWIVTTGSFAAFIGMVDATMLLDPSTVKALVINYDHHYAEAAANAEDWA